MQKLSRTILTLTFFVICTCIQSPSHALDVDVDELKKAHKVEFHNYQGPPKNADPLESIIAIGAGLGVPARNNVPIRFHMKYSVIHAISKNEIEKLSADIFSIDRDARVDHIKNIRRILSAYLIKRYGYSSKNAHTLAFFVTYYNAVYRGDIEYFKTIYKSIVLDNINPDNAGISIEWNEWPGKTKMLIPLTEDPNKKGLDSIDPDIITDDNVRKTVRRDGGNIDERKDVIKLKEDIISKDKERLNQEKNRTELEKQELKKEKDEITERKKEITGEKEKIRQKENETIKQKETVKQIPDNEERKKEEQKIVEKEKEIVKEKEQLKKKEDETMTRDRNVVEKEKEVTRTEEKTRHIENRIIEKEKKVEKEKKEIQQDEIFKTIETKPEEAKDQLREKAGDLEKKEKELDRREDELRNKQADRNIYADKLYYLKINEWIINGHLNAEMYMIDAVNNNILFKSPVENISGRRYDVFSEGVVVITRKLKSYESEHNLTLLDRDTLAAKIYGKNVIFWRSFIEIRDGYIYAIINENNTYYLGRFDKDLKLTARSSEQVYEDTFITFYKDRVYINRSDRKIMILKKEDLTQVTVVNSDQKEGK